MVVVVVVVVVFPRGDIRTYPTRVGRVNVLFKKKLFFYSGGFFLAWQDCGKMFDHSFPACAFLLSLSLFFFFFEMDISSRTLIPRFMPGSVHSGSAS